jgi:hypothetical protein
MVKNQGYFSFSMVEIQGNAVLLRPTWLPPTPRLASVYVCMTTTDRMADRTEDRLIVKKLEKIAKIMFLA